MPRVVASIEARMASTRLPGKVLADIAGTSALERLTTRLKAARRLDDIVLATTRSSTDDPVAEWATNQGIACFRGSEDDVLKRVVEAHRKMDSEIVVEVCGDTPLLDPAVIDQAVEAFDEGDCDIVSNTWTVTYPQGIDAQVFRRKDLEEVEQTVTDPAVREHVSLYFYENPDRYRLKQLLAPDDLKDPDLRLQMDYPEDLELIRLLYERLEPGLGPVFGVHEVLKLMEQEPELRQLNANCVERPIR